MSYEKIHMRVMVPEKIVMERSVDKIVAEAVDGFFCLKPRHIDCTAALRPGILYSYEGESEYVIAIDEGILVKVGKNVFISANQAIEGDDLTQLEQEVRDQFYARERSEEKARIVLQNIEADLIRHFVELEKGIEDL